MTFSIFFCGSLCIHFAWSPFKLFGPLLTLNNLSDLCINLISDAMVDVGERLENPFNIENVVEPVNFKVSDAIMNFQEAGHDISNKVRIFIFVFFIGKLRKFSFDFQFFRGIDFCYSTIYS